VAPIEIFAGNDSYKFCLYYHLELFDNMATHQVITERTMLVICFHAGFLLGLFLELEDGGNMFLRNAC
jgi:hypothetical protein